MRIALCLACALIFPAPAAARESLGVFGEWAAFRDTRPPRCFAIAEPVTGPRGKGWRPFASVANWPRLGQRGQLHIRLSRQRRARTPLTLLIGEQRFPLAAGSVDAWASDARTDAAIVAAMRSGAEMVVIGTGERGRIRDIYHLQGAATAIDAAALGCAKLR